MFHTTLALFLLGTIPAQLSLEAAHDIAYENNIDLKIASARLQQASVLTKKAYTALLPTVSLNGRLTYNNLEISLDFPDFENANLQDVISGGELPTTTSEIQRNWQTNAGLGVNWVLLNGRSIPAIKIASATVDQAELRDQQLRALLIHSVSLTFLNVVSAQEQVLLRRRAFDNSLRHFERAKAQEELGQLDSMPTLRAETEHTQNEQLLQVAQQTLRLSKLSLATLLGQSDERGAHDEFEAIVPEALFSQEPPEQEEQLWDEAKRTRLDLASKNLDLNIAQSYRLDSWMQFAPTLVGFFNLNWTDTTGFAGENWTWNAGLSLSWTLFDGGIRYFNLKETKYQRLAATLELEKAQQDGLTDVVQQRQEVENALSRLATAEKRKNLAFRAAELSRAQFDAGSIEQLELFDAERSLRDAETALLFERLSAASARLELQLSLTGARL